MSNQLDGNRIIQLVLQKAIDVVQNIVEPCVWTMCFGQGKSRIRR